MASPPHKKSASSARRRDRISDLTDEVLGHVLSFLPTKEAGCTAILGRRWRDIFRSVHTIKFEEAEGEREEDWFTDHWESADKRSCSGVLLDCISSALLRHRIRCASDRSGHPVPLRSFHFAFDSYDNWDKVAVDQWLFEVLCQSDKKELHLDLRFFIGPICSDDDDEKNENKKWGYVLPMTLFSHTAIRTLCLGHCKLNLPESIDLPLLKTLRLTSILGDDSEETTQRLICSCPRLLDLTLEANKRLKRITILDKRLRRFALRCCHNMTKVIIDASELRSLEYNGMVPKESLMSLGVSPGLASCTIRFCRVGHEESELLGFRRFMEKVCDSKHLNLHHFGLVEGGFFTSFPSFFGLKSLELQGPVQSRETVDMIRRIMEHTPNLEVLSLYMELDPQTPQTQLDDELDEDGDEKEYERSVVLDNLRVPDDESSFSMHCLRRRVKEINMVNYEYDVYHRTLAWLLFRNALVLERMCVVLRKGQLTFQSKLKEEIESWLVTKPEKSFM
uniref:Uncharacterized protein n=1 Tax=Avena sativa TaxID=4498 RepID=A0ACD5V1M2_AVESA